MSKEVVNWEEKLAQEAKTVAKIERPKLGSIGTRAGMLSYGGQQIKGNVLDAIVVGYVFENSFFAHEFDPNNPRNPDCYAFMTPEEAEDPSFVMRPHAQVMEPVNEVCGTCSHMQWQPNPKTGRNHKLCKEIRKLCLLPVSALESPEAIAAAELATLRLPVTSVKNWKQYVNDIAGIGRTPYSVITAIAPKPHMKNQFEITFERKANLDSDYLGAVSARIPAVMEILTSPYDKNAEGSPQESKKF